MINRTVNFLFKVNNYLYFRILSLYKRITIGNNFCIHGYVNVSIADKSILSIGTISGKGIRERIEGK